MIVAIPVNSNERSAGVNQAFARTPYFYIFDTEKNEGIYVDNVAGTKSGGAGIKAAQLLVDNGVDSLIAPRCGENAADVLKVANIKLYKSNGTCVRGNIEDFVSGKLEELTGTEAGLHKI